MSANIFTNKLSNACRDDTQLKYGKLQPAIIVLIVLIDGA